MIKGATHSRLIYAAPQLQMELKEAWSEAGVQDRIGRLMADFDHFSTGGLITVSTGSERHAYMKQLDKLSEEVWEIRSRDPKPSLRIFGRFTEADVFIGTHMCTRPYLGYPGSKEWRDEFERCKSEWRKLFQGYEPLSGEKINDYISENVVDLGQLK